MPRYFLKRLAIEGFRGINNENTPLDLSFRPDTVNSLFAVNAIGKSSIFESLCYAIHGTLPKLKSLQAQERPQDYYNNRFHSRNAASIVVEFEPDDGNAPVSIQIDRNADGNRSVSSPSGHPDPENFLTNLREAFVLLDYSTFARFIEDSPLDRGRTFSSLLGLAEYSDCRQALEAVSESRALNTDLEIGVLNEAIKSAKKRAEDALANLRLMYEKVTGRPLEDIARLDDRADEIAAVLGKVEILKPHTAGQSLVDIDIDAIRTEIRTAEGGEERKNLEKTVSSLTSLEALAIHNAKTIAEEQKKFGVLVEEQEELLALTRGDLFRRFYESADELISEGAWTEDEKCPLCESLLHSSIGEHIANQLAQYSTVAAKNEEIKSLWRTSTWKPYLSACEAAAPLAVPPKDKRASELNQKFLSGEISGKVLADAVNWSDTLTTRVGETSEALRDQKKAIERDLPPSLVQLTEQVEYASQFKNSLELYQANHREQTAQQSRLEIRQRWKDFISRAKNAFGQAESALSRHRIESIESEYKSMFREIMNVEDVVPELERANGKERLHVQLGEFYGQHNLSARALLSESFRNGLAISVFLAAAQKHSGLPRFVVLDDVTSSFDAGHQNLLMNLIHTRLQQPRNRGGLQFIILSHDSMLEKYFDRMDSETDWHNIKLQGLPPVGAVLHQAQGAARLKSTLSGFLSAGQVNEAEPLIRQYLEYKLQQIIRKVDIPVPIDFAIKDTKRMVKNCTDAIVSAINLHKSAGTLVLDQQQILDIDKLHMPAIVGNWLSHYETGTVSGLSAPVLNGVISSIDALSECFRYDDTSGGTPVRRWYKGLDKK